MYEIRAMAEIPLCAIIAPELERIKKSLTYTPKRFSVGKTKEEAEPIYGFAFTRLKLYLPIDWARKNLPYEFLDCTTLGDDAPALDNSRIKPRDAAQAAFFKTLITKLGQDGVAFGLAGTGKGKTVAALNAAAAFGRKTLIVVPQTNILQQWKEEAIKHLGLREDQVGIVQQDKCEFDRPLMIGIVHSLAQRDYPSAFYSSIGFVAYDEADTLGAPSFNRVMRRFPAKYKLALTATMDRKDGCSGLVTNHFGTDFIRSNQDDIPCQILPVLYGGQDYKSYIKKSYNFGQVLSAIADNDNRTGFAVGWIKWLVSKGYDVLGLSDRTEQLATAKDMLKELGIHADLYIGSTPEKEKARIRDEGKVILATRGMFRRATNVPRLGAAVELTPSAEPEQEIGRIRRPYEGKGIPIWITIVDAAIPFLQKINTARLNKCLALPGVTVRK